MKSGEGRVVADRPLLQKPPIPRRRHSAGASSGTPSGLQARRHHLQSLGVTCWCTKKCVESASQHFTSHLCDGRRGRNTVYDNYTAPRKIPASVKLVYVHSATALYDIVIAVACCGPRWALPLAALASRLHARPSSTRRIRGDALSAQDLKPRCSMPASSTSRFTSSTRAVSRKATRGLDYVAMN